MCNDQEETREVQEKGIEHFKGKGDQQQFTVEGGNAEITVDLVLQAMAKMCDNKVNGTEDAVVSEMTKQLPLEKIYTIMKCFQERFSGQVEAPSWWKIVKLVLRNSKLQSHRFEIGDVKVVHMMHYTSLGAPEGTTKLEEIGRGRNDWDKLPAFANDGDKIVTKTMGMARRKTSHIEHGSVLRTIVH